MGRQIGFRRGRPPSPHPTTAGRRKSQAALENSRQLFEALSGAKGAIKVFCEIAAP